MTLSESIKTILNFRNLPDGWDGGTEDKPSDDIIIEALDLVRKFRRAHDVNIYIDVAGIDTVIKFDWKVKKHGIIELVLSDEYLKLYVVDNSGNLLVNGVEINHLEFEVIDFIIDYFIGIITGEIKNNWRERCDE